jgi:two-component system cell cycle sensor histidine kinase/response regulator CckA
MNVLIVDDIATNRKLLRITLEAEGYATCEAADGVEALEMLARETVDAVISDILMPNMDGYQLCHALRKDTRWGALPFIFYTATYTSADDEQLASKMGGNRFLRKPATAKVICAALKEVTDGNLARVTPKPDPDHEVHVLQEYSGRLVNKLEQRSLQLARQNEDLLRLQERYRDLLENTSDLTQTLALDGRILHANRAWQTALGYGADELGQLSVFDIIHPDQRGHCRALFARLPADGAPGPFEVRMVARDGRELTVEANVKVQLADGVPNSVRCIFRDLTARAEFAEEHGRLALRLSHHLRTPLNGILGLSDLIRSDDASMSGAELQDLANTIHTSAQRLGRVIDKLLDLVELEATAASPQHVASLRQASQADAREFLHGCTRRVAADHQREADLTLALAPGAVGMSAYWLGRLIARPLDNAFRYSPPGSPVNLETRATPKGFTIVMRDHGPGMTPEQLAKCAHLQPVSSTERDHPGVGVGLVLARRIAELHRGSLALESAPGKGTTVTIHLPAAHALASGTSL